MCEPSKCNHWGSWEQMSISEKNFKLPRWQAIITNMTFSGRTIQLDSGTVTGRGVFFLGQVSCFWIWASGYNEVCVRFDPVFSYCSCTHMVFDWLYQKLNVMTKVMMRWKWYFLGICKKDWLLEDKYGLRWKDRERQGDTGRLNKHWMLWVDMG